MLGLIKATIILFFCIAVAGAFLRIIDRKLNVIPYVLSWAILVPIIFLTQSYYLIMATLIGIKIIYLKNDVIKNISMFFALLVVMPVSFEFALVPGVNIIEVHIIHMLSIIFFLPMIVTMFRSDDFKFVRPDIVVMGLMIILIAGNFRETSLFEFTWFQAYRDTIKDILTLVVPYFVISRGLSTFESIDKVIPGLLFGGIIMAIFALFEASLSWRPYVDAGLLIGSISPLEAAYETRGGILRVTGALTGPITFGFYLTLIMSMMLYFLRKNKTPIFIIGMASFIIVLCVFFTGSRAALLGAAVLLVLYLFSALGRSLRRILVFPLIIVLSFGFFISEVQQPVKKQSPELATMDKYGTLDYRQRLFATAIEVIPENLWLGTRMYRKHKRMESLRQGQGIIDMVNGYIHITIEYGLVAFILLMIVFIRPFYLLIREIVSTEERRYLLLEEEESLNSFEEEFPLNRHDVKPEDEYILYPEEPESGQDNQFLLEDQTEHEQDGLDGITEVQKLWWRSLFSQSLIAILISLGLQFYFTSYSSTIIIVLWVTFALARAVHLGVVLENDSIKNRQEEQLVHSIQ